MACTEKIIINVSDLKCVLFADDTTVYCADSSISQVTAKMDRKFTQVTSWTQMNRMIINWTKTKAMFISRKDLPAPAAININNNQLQVVQDFKLLGININNHLDFSAHIAAIKKGINTRLFSIKKIYFLPTSVKLQFLKSFILPYFDYCLSLSIYYIRSNLLQLEKLYNFCLLKLLSVNLKNVCLQEQLKLLLKFNLQPFKARLYTRVSIFIYNVDKGRLLEGFKLKLKENKCTYNLRKKRQFVAPSSRTQFGSRRLLTFYCQAVNNIFVDALALKFNELHQSLQANISIYSPKLLKLLNLQ